MRWSSMMRKDGKKGGGRPTCSAEEEEAGEQVGISEPATARTEGGSSLVVAAREEAGKF